ncbi:putative ribosome-associated RNA-binding protein Tma20 [Luteibacter sp. Sphag1AF]|uniref:hypothetical protein n=1 Tax=Luteibacter sp. Sphag1AF TaxID=2587031 RepID=UPI00161B0280|nr:hypothetical protein [Luteibacter sp. Sphag1AF]MBB3225976.1 putative ribosome-associated RNA-binding protein Tma20 [Luteibacter sp. Sphag1AF]
MRNDIEEGFMVFVADGQDGIGSVRGVKRDTEELVIYIENAGDFVVPVSAVADVHSGKVILNLHHLGADLRDALRHAHDSEYPH